MYDPRDQASDGLAVGPPREDEDGVARDENLTSIYFRAAISLRIAADLIWPADPSSRCILSSHQDTKSLREEAD